jgi:hypothetical protein
MSAQLAIAWEDSSLAPARHDAAREPRHLCAACHQRPARFQYRGVVKADRLHTLCFRCYRSAMDSLRNVEPVGRVTWLRPAGISSRGRVDGRFPGHAPRPVDPADKYAELTRRRRRAQIAARHALQDAPVRHVAPVGDGGG